MMQRICSKKLCLLSIYQVHLSVGNPRTLGKEPFFLFQFLESSKPVFFSTHSRLGSSKIPPKLTPNLKPGNPISKDGICNRSDEPRKVLDLIHLENDTESSRECQIQIHDDFAADVEKVYRILRKFHSRVPKLELALQESGVLMRSGLTERVLNRCGDAGNLGYRFFVWASKQPGYRHSYDVYKSMIKILGKMRQFGAVWALIEEMRKENPQLLSPEVFVILMRRFASSRMVKKAIEVLDEMPKYGCEPDEYVFGCLLDALCKNGSVKEAALLFDDMRIRFKPTIKHFTSLLYGWCKEGKLMEAKVVLVKMREAGFEPDIVVYNNLLNGYSVAGKMVDAFHLLQEMKRTGCEPNATSYTIMIQALCAREKMEEAIRVFMDMESNGCEADIVTYTTLISGFCKSGKIEKGYELLDGVIQKGHTPNQTTYLYFMLAHEKKEELEECLDLMKEMRKISVLPDSSIYNTVIRLACKLGETEDGMRLMNELEATGISPDKLQLAKDVWSCIIAKGCELNVYAWTIWIHALFSNGHVKDACSYCLDMMDAGVMPQPDTFAKLMRGLRKLYNRQIAAEITEKVRKMAAERQMTFKMYKRRGERDLKEKAKAKKDGRKRRARRRQWGSRNRKADIF
ncbi:UNVERIFIED_CONTAM: putative pentatricopeptide repeat-containing protein [Sesamum radiatum]|uniref:Pentatricopeptide repeat-containing protein n=1 Tax=Sesamum radiatum TaxID=300843 RepID=A0AAW2V404_SESRA